MKLRALALAFLMMGLGACSSSDKSSDEEQAKIDKEFNYSNMIDAHSRGESIYDGFNNTFQYQATLLNTKMINAQLRKRAALQLWDNDKLEQERTKKFQEIATRTEMFLSFFSPDRNVVNLDNKKTVWRAYLDIDGRRYVGDIKKLAIPLVDIVALYPYHNRWSTPYLVTFAVPTTAVEKKDAKLTLTGSVGTSTVTFPPE
jgi:hypothetical protein